MSEVEFLGLAERTLAHIETLFDRLQEEEDVDIESRRQGNVLEVEVGEARTKIIINIQTAMQEIWMATKLGGFHYRLVESCWINTRDGSELMGTLFDFVGQECGRKFLINFEFTPSVGS
jgi:CyaY protein